MAESTKRRAQVRLRIFGLVAVLSAAAVLAGSQAITARTNAARVATTTTVVRVIMTEYHFAVSKKTVPVGTVVFTLVNKGTLPHNMAFTGPVLYKRAPLVDPGSTYRFKVVFKKAGSYRFLCTPHFKLGMSGTIRIRT